MSWRIIEKDGRRFRVAVVRTAGGSWVGWRGESTFIEPKVTAGAQSRENPDEVRAPLTGKVIKVSVSAGEQVEVDQVLVILEAMKMEYRLTAPRSGAVDEVRCNEGELVDQGATLVRMGA